MNSNKGTPVSVIEAMAAGCCVVATRAGGTGDIVLNEENGLTVPVGDAEALAVGIVRAVENPAERQKFGEKEIGRASCRERG